MVERWTYKLKCSRADVLLGLDPGTGSLKVLLTDVSRQLLADVLGRPLRPLPDEVAGNASARGAALLAGQAAGVYASAADTLVFAPEPGEEITPGEDAVVYEAPYARYKELYQRLG